MVTYGLLGYPLGHSFSREYFTERFRRERTEAQYLNFETPQAEDLLQIVEQHPDLRGLNVTLPHKQAVLPLMDELSPDAKAIGAVNCIRVDRRKDGSRTLKGYNADVIGFMRSISPLLQSHHGQALVLGTGGAACAVVYGLEKLGLQVTQVSRTPRSTHMLSYEKLQANVMAAHTVVVNATPLGMWPHVDQCPPIPYDMLTPRHLLFDLVYNPALTLFLQKGEARGATIKNGLEMLHLQAEASYEFWNENVPSEKK